VVRGLGLLPGVGAVGVVGGGRVRVAAVAQRERVRGRLRGGRRRGRLPVHGHRLLSAVLIQSLGSCMMARTGYARGAARQ